MSVVSPVPDSCSSRLAERKEEILALWEARSLKEVPAASTGASLALRDSLPVYLDHLGSSLATNRRMDFRSTLAHDEEATRIGKMHGADRATNRSYVLTEVIFEYHILREVIFQVLEREGPLAQESRNIILDSLEQAVNDAAVEFSEVHADIQQKFINTLTHDLKTPITAAKLGAQLILRSEGLPAAPQAWSRKIVGNLNRLESMIHDLLDASRIRAGERLTLHFAKCDLDEVLREVVDEMVLIYGDRIVFESVEPLHGEWGCDGLRRAVENLVGNAVKYGEAESPITVSLLRREAGIEISVHNRGPVIPAPEIPRLFQQYRRAARALEGGSLGWGLGLTLVKGVVDAHQGHVRVESAEGKGTRFTLEIPFPDVDTAADALKKHDSG